MTNLLGYTHKYPKGNDAILAIDYNIVAPNFFYCHHHDHLWTGHF